MTIPCRVLMVYPKFIPNSFWNYTEACELVGAKYPAAPLGLITVAALCPKEWEFRLVNRNTEALTDEDLDWADLVMIGGMLNQQPDFIYLIDLAHLHGKPVCVGGPDVSSSPHLYAAADFQVIGEAEHIMAEFIAAWERGNRKHVRPMMPKLKEWLQKHDYPFEFTTEASINIADDDDMLQAMKDANFFGIFVGIESPDPETLIQMRKKQNTKRNIAESIHK